MVVNIVRFQFHTRAFAPSLSVRCPAILDAHDSNSVLPEC